MRNLILIITIAVFVLLASPTQARVGVGVNLGKIDIDEPLIPGGTYKFPAIGVINTGDESSEYGMDISYHEDQDGQRPPKEWFTFTPATFTLDGSASQSVAVSLTLPVNAPPGDYFALLEAHPIVSAQGGTTIGIAAATKTTFTVGPASLFQALLQKTSSFFRDTYPWSTIVLVVIGLAVLLTIFKKFFSFNIAVKRKP